MVAKVKAKKKPAVRAQRAGRTSTSRISSKNQITIPVEVLRTLNLEPGDIMEISVTDDGKIEVKKEAVRNLFQELADIAGDNFINADLEAERKYSWG